MNYKTLDELEEHLDKIIDVNKITFVVKDDRVFINVKLFSTMLEMRDLNKFIREMLTIVYVTLDKVFGDGLEDLLKEVFNTKFQDNYEKFSKGMFKSSIHERVKLLAEKDFKSTPKAKFEKHCIKERLKSFEDRTDQYMFKLSEIKDNINNELSKDNQIIDDFKNYLSEFDEFMKNGNYKFSETRIDYHIHFLRAFTGYDYMSFKGGATLYDYYADVTKYRDLTTDTWLNHIFEIKKRYYEKISKK